MYWTLVLVIKYHFEYPVNLILQSIDKELILFIEFTES